MHRPVYGMRGAGTGRNEGRKGQLTIGTFFIIIRNNIRTVSMREP